MGANSYLSIQLIYQMPEKCREFSINLNSSQAKKQYLEDMDYAKDSFQNSNQLQVNTKDKNLPLDPQDDDIFEGRIKKMHVIICLDENGNKQQVSSPKIKYGQYSNNSPYSSEQSYIL